MNIVNSGNRFQVYGDGIKTYKQLPVGSYNIEFQQMVGFFLSERNDLIVTEKVYGNVMSKVDKVLRSYMLTNRNFGVLLSGQKGIGKSLFVRLVAQQAINANIPVIVVSRAIFGLNDFISSIDQDCVVILDEFEKTFARQEDWNPQDDMLSLFDGTDGGHKLFLVTCNDLSNLNQYMLNRPGRFHYHFTMQPPSIEEVREYLQDQVKEEYQNAIEDVVNISKLIDMPYDFLRAIAFELNQGYDINEAMNDLNITRATDMKFDLKVYCSNGMCWEAFNEKVDINNHGFVWVRVRRFDNSNDFLPKEVEIEFPPSRLHIVGNEYIINDNIHLLRQYDSGDFYDLPEETGKKIAEVMNQLKFERMALTKVVSHGPGRFMV